MQHLDKFFLFVYLFPIPSRLSEYFVILKNSNIPLFNHLNLHSMTPNRLLFKPMLAMLSLVFLLGFTIQTFAQSDITVMPEKLSLDVGESATLKANVKGDDGNEIEDAQFLFFTRRRKGSGAVEVDSTGLVTAKLPGEAIVIVIYPHPDGKYLRANIPVSIAYPALSRIEFNEPPQSILTDIPTAIEATILDKMDLERNDLEINFSSSNPKIASFDAFNNLTGHEAGKTTITAKVEDITAEFDIKIEKNPVEAIQLTANVDEALSGDVIYFETSTLDKSGKEVKAPVTYTFQGKSAEQSEFAGGLIKPDGRFVAYQPGIYTITAVCGKNSAQKVVRISDRQEVIKRDIELVGKGSVTDKHTSDLWVWEGVDGRDYAVTGTWGADGEAFFWDVTDPANMFPVDTVKVDARTVNDVKVSEDGRICIISREGASNRKNGIIIFDVTDPSNVWKISEYSDGLTGGVHNLFIYDNHVFALSNAERYDIINIEDPATPYKVGEYEIPTPGHSIHDVWVVDGIAYSSNWHDGVHIVDVGNGIAGGTPAKPVLITSFTYPSGWNHAAFPFFSKTTGKFYVIAGDEAFPYGLHVKDDPVIAAGWLHIFDVTDMENPVEVAKYEVEGAGSHNFWVDGETLYVANYNAGLRVVDISGELLGDLRAQGREMGWFMSTDPKGYVPNAAMTWGPQPHKGHIFFSDWNSGLWSVKMEEKRLKN
jgi:hypothetical protein